MTLNKADHEYLDSANTRIRTRVVVAVLIGIFASWFWLVILTVLFGFGELATMNKILRHLSDGSVPTNETPDDKARRHGKVFGQSAVGAFMAWISVIVVAGVVKLAKTGVLLLFSKL
jgi:uncharacterized membrane protein